MSTRNHEWSAFWNGLPNPVADHASAPGPCSITLGSGALKHVVIRHIEPGDEPWEDWFPTPLISALVEFARGDLDEATGRKTFREAAALFEAAVRRSMARPLVLVYQSRGTGDTVDRGIAYWNLVTPHGALIVVRSPRGVAARVVTGFFPAEVETRSAQIPLWQAAIASLVRRYADFVPGVGWVPPGPEKAHHVREPGTGPIREVRSIFRYITLSSWGFSDDPDGPGWHLDSIPDWDAAPIATPPLESKVAVLGYRLNPNALSGEERGHV